MTRPSVLLIDDEPGPQAQRRRMLQRRGLHADLRSPQTVTREDVERADLVLVDLALENWPERDRAESLGLRPMDGLALAAILRSHIGYGQQDNPTAFALHTGQLERLAGDAPRELRQHGLARIHNLEWVFLKGDREVNSEVVVLAAAVAEMPAVWPTDVHAASSELERLLRLADTREFADAARLDIERSKPPVHELSSLSEGVTALRWMLHRVLPYPTFLWDDWRLATRLGVSVTSLAKALEGPLKTALSPYEYDGFLDGFLGRRWWRAGVESWIDDHMGDEPLSSRALGHSLAGRYTSLEPLDMRNPIVCVDAEYRNVDITESSEAVRIQLDDWPPYADVPWTRITTAVKDPGVAARVLLEDQIHVLAP